MANGLGMHALVLSAGLAGSLGAAASIITTSATRHEEAVREQWIRQGDLSVPYPSPASGETNADGYSRLTTAGLALGGLATAAGAAIFHRPTLALGAIGASLGFAGATLLTGHGSLGDRVAINVGVLDRGFSVAVRGTISSTHPSVAAQLPLAGDSGSTSGGSHGARSDANVASPPQRAARPSAAELRAAPLELSPGKPDAALVKRNVDAAYRHIDFSKRDIVIWLPATDEHYFPSALRQGLRDEVGAHDASTVLLDYPASWDLSTSVPTGMASLRELLARIADHGGDHRVLLAGHSQGAWVIADSMADSAVHGMVDRALLLGSPGMAQRHYTDRRDAKVVEVDDGGDQLSHPLRLRGQLLAGMHAFVGGDVAGEVPLVAVAAANLRLATYMAARAVDVNHWRNEPHRYESQMQAGAQWLATGGVTP